MVLSPKRQQFVDEYLIDLNATQAAIRAGYAKAGAGQQGDRLLKNVQIASAIAEAMETRATKTAITAEYVLETIKETVERCAQHRPVLDRSGNPVMVETPTGEAVPAFAFDSAGVLKGCELLGKHINLFPTKQIWKGELTVRNEDAVPRPKTFEEWMQYVEAQAAQPLIEMQALPAPGKVNGQ